jgi:hypothetical protein
MRELRARAFPDNQTTPIEEARTQRRREADVSRTRALRAGPGRNEPGREEEEPHPGVQESGLQTTESEVSVMQPADSSGTAKLGRQRAAVVKDMELAPAR